MLAFYSCSSKLPQTYLLTIQIYYFIILEVRNPKSAFLGWNQGIGRIDPSGSSRGESIFCFCFCQRLTFSASGYLSTFKFSTPGHPVSPLICISCYIIFAVFDQPTFRDWGSSDLIVPQVAKDELLMLAIPPKC